MGEIFRHEPPAQELEFTGERWTSAAHGQIEIEHLHRYLLARDLCHGKDVLDIACGEGYGTALLAQVARRVTGVDIDRPTLAHAAAHYVRPNLRYVVGDARAIPVATASVDTVVSFETLEHFAEQDAFLLEVHRVLRPGGVLVISTPDSDVYSPVGAGANAYHLRELSREEFVAVLSRRFRHVAVSAQRALVGSAIIPRHPEPALATAVTFERRDDRHLERSDGLPRAVYLLACASDQPIAAPVARVFIFTARKRTASRRLRRSRAKPISWPISRARDAAQAVAEAAQQARAGMESEVARLRDALSHAEEDMWQRAGAAETMRAEIATLSGALAEAERRLGEDAEEAARIRAEIGGFRLMLEGAMRAAEDAATMHAEIASLQNTLATARQVGRAALEALARGHAIPAPAPDPVGWRQSLRRIFASSRRRSVSKANPPVQSSPAQLGDALPARAPR